MMTNPKKLEQEGTERYTGNRLGGSLFKVPAGSTPKMMTEMNPWLTRFRAKDRRR